MAKGKTDNADKAPAAHPATNATLATNEWGIPDWRDPAAYGDVEPWTFNRWRWEFYRRRDDLRIFFDLWAASNAERNLRRNNGKQAHEPGFVAFGMGKDAGEAIRRFDYGGVPNPRIGDQPEIIIMPCEEFFHRQKFFNPKERRPLGFSVLTALGKKTSQQYDLHLEPHEYAIKFDLKQPLASQLEEAKEILQRNQKALHGRTVQRKRQPSLWLGYLRALDAREADVTWAEITEIFHAQGLLDRRKSASGGYCAPPPQAARDKWKSANALRFNF